MDPMALQFVGIISRLIFDTGATYIQGEPTYEYAGGRMEGPRESFQSFLLFTHGAYRFEKFRSAALCASLFNWAHGRPSVLPRTFYRITRTSQASTCRPGRIQGTSRAPISLSLIIVVLSFIRKQSKPYQLTTRRWSLLRLSFSAHLGC